MKITKNFPCNINELENIALFIESSLLSFGLDKKHIKQTQLITEELFTNVVKYGGVKEKALYTIEIGKMDNSLMIVYKDQGTAFNPLEKKDPDINASLEDKPIGGLGIYLVKQLSDQVLYKRNGNINEITVIKNL